MDNLALVERAVAFACRRYRFDAGDAEELAAIVNLKLVEDDYAILRTYQRRSAFSTWISIVVQRTALDYRTAAWGKWHASAEAKRIGPVAVELEQLLHRDGRTIEQAHTILSTKHGGVTIDTLRSLGARLPERAQRRRAVALEEAEFVAVTSPDDIDETAMADDRQRVAGRVSAIMADLLENLPDQDRLILQLRFEGGMTVAQIARALQLDQKLLYRRIEHRMREIRRTLIDAGLDPGDVVDLIGREGPILDFHLRNRTPRPSIRNDESATAHTEAPE